jgi:hypothetical protein
MQVFRRKNNHGRLLQPAREGPQNLWRPGAYGEVWRTGANEATTYATNENLNTVKGTNMPAGSYTIFAVPDPDKWRLIINKHTRNQHFWLRFKNWRREWDSNPR